MSRRTSRTSASPLAASRSIDALDVRAAACRRTAFCSPPGAIRSSPESKPTLDDIGQMLSQHPELKLTIEGHTDNAGNAASNQTLSEKRAASVRQYLDRELPRRRLAAGEQRLRRDEARGVERHPGGPPAEPARRPRHRSEASDNETSSDGGAHRFGGRPPHGREAESAVHRAGDGDQD